MTRQEFEAALDSGRLQIQTNNGRWYDVRRNGRTKTWKTRPASFETPIKWAFRECGQVTDVNINNGEIRIAP